MNYHEWLEECEQLSGKMYGVFFSEVMSEEQLKDNWKEYPKPFDFVEYHANKHDLARIDQKEW